MRSGRRLFYINAALAGVFSVVLAGCNKAPETAGTPPPSTTIGTELDDSVVTAKVKSALLADEIVRSFEFKVETRKGEVQLSGFAANQVQIDRAIEVTRGVPGVKNIDNKMSLKGAATTVGNEVDDGIITTEVKTALLADAYVKSADIAVTTRKGEVQLSGFVNNQSQIDRAIEVARGVKGVRTVGNQMSIKK
jgi:hyperosmotically inducible periplasmic protein